MALPKLEGIITIPSGSSVSVTETGGGGTSSVSLNAGEYSLSEFCTYFASALTSNSTLSGTYSCTISDDSDSSTGKVTLSATGITSFTLTWTETTPRDVLGFDDTLTPTASSFTATNASPYIFLPNVGRSDAGLADGDDGIPVRTVAVNVAPSGDVYGWASASLRYEDVIEFEHLKGYKTLRSLEVVTNESLQSFHEAVISKGTPFRYHVSRADDDTYTEHVAKQGSSERMPVTPLRKDWRGAQSLWTARYEVYTPSSTSTAWTPLDLSPLAWYRADTNSRTGSDVDTWTDLSGNGNHLTGTTTGRPTYATGAVNGKPALTFSDSAPSLLTASGITIPTNGSVIVVQKLTSGKTSYRLGVRGTANEPSLYMQDDTSTGAAIYWTSGFALTHATDNSDSVWRSVRFMWGSSLLSVAYNNGSATTTARTGSHTVSGTFHRVGSTAGVHAFDGQIAEIIVVGSELTTDQVTSLNAYLSDRYGLW